MGKLKLSIFVLALFCFTVFFPLTTLGADNTKTYYGLAINKIVVYSDNSTQSTQLKNYPQGSLLKYQPFSTDWYICKVYVNGKPKTGYIKTSDIENGDTSPTTLYGIGSKSPIKVYSDGTSTSNELKSYDFGTLLKYKTFTSDWYLATVYVNGRPTNGLINKSDVVNGDSSPQNLYGIGINSVNIYSRATTDSDALKTYNSGSILKYETFTADWYKAVVYKNGKRYTGFIRKADVENADPSPQELQGIGLTSTKIYSSASTSSSTLKSYPVGSILKYNTFTSGWYQAKVYINGKPKTGYINKSNVENVVSKQEIIHGFGIKKPTNIYSMAATSSTVLKSYSVNSELIYKTFTSNWMEATVYINGKKYTGYINKNDVATEPLVINETTKYDYTLDSFVQKQLDYRPQTDKYRNEDAYVYSSLVDITQSTTISADGVNLRTEPKLIDETIAPDSPVDKGTVVEILDEVQGDSYAGSTKWYKIKYNDSTLYVHSSLVQTSKVAKLNSTSNIREAATTDSHIFTTLGSGKKVGITGEVDGQAVNADNTKWYKVTIGAWRNAKSNDVLDYLDPSKQDKYQFLVLSGTAGSSEADLKNLLVNKGVLAETESSFLTASKDNNVNEVYLVSHALLETGNGTSLLAKGVYVDNQTGVPLRDKNGKLYTDQNKPANAVKVYNMFGISAYDANPINGGAKYAFQKGWTTKEKAINGGAEWISTYYINNSSYKQNTLYKMRWNPVNPGRHQYATDIGWAAKQIYSIKNLYNQLPNAKLTFDIPKFK